MLQELPDPLSNPPTLVPLPRPTQTGPVALGQLLLASGVVNEVSLQEGLALHRRSGVRLGEALISLGHVRADQVARALAQQQQVEVFDPRQIHLINWWPGLQRDDWYRRNRVVPLPGADGTLRAVTSDPTDDIVLAQLAHKMGQLVRPAVATNRDIERILHEVYLDANVRLSSELLREQSPESSADVVLTRRQKIIAGLLLGSLLAGLLANWSLALTVAVSLVTLLYTSSSAYMLYLTITGWATRQTVAVADAGEVDERDLPVYTILVPLYREAEVLPQLARAIQALDWPKAKLDVRLLLEEDDLSTIEAARDAHLPAYFTFVIVPARGPRGKPKACNYGLAHARGEYVVIYDAEDVPEPDQLKKVHALFWVSDPDLVCIQCRLNFYNPEQNLLTRWFTAEYSLWFDLLLPGLQRAGAPIPLGGTSNHFRRAALEEVGAWDPYNVTEDADLGIRLFKRRRRTVVLDSTTYEEANPEVGNWIRQRSRWIKGYAQTWLVHMRHPVELWRVLGPRGFFGFQWFVGGRVLVLLLNPCYWGLTLLWFLTHSLAISHLFPAPVFYLGSLALYLGNIAFLYLGMAGVLARGRYRLVKWTLLTPLYWVLMSIAAWKGVLQLISRPHYWEKTRHGLARAADITIEPEGDARLPVIAGPETLVPAEEGAA
jgi:cellulose synthase/poly-beta-1,6-N-acetylglucosamine synthase-like glycosyltransferase